MHINSYVSILHGTIYYQIFVRAIEDENKMKEKEYYQ